MNKKIWDNQKQFNIKFFQDNNLNLDELDVKEKIKWAKEFYFHINKELTDLIQCFPRWKMHYPNEEIDVKLIKSNLKEEYIDALKYFMGLGQVLGISYDDIIKIYEAKTEVVEQKYQQNKLFEELKSKEIVIFDIDGVINNYPKCFLDWVQKGYSSLEELKQNVGIKEYERYKEMYRLSGEKSKQPVNMNTRSTMKYIKFKLNTHIVLYTARPVSRYKRIYSDTLKWLKKNDIPFDAIYWTDFQKEDFYKLGLKIKFIVEDDISNAELFASEGYKVYLLNSRYNLDKKNIVKIEETSDILKEI